MKQKMLPLALMVLLLCWTGISITGCASSQAGRPSVAKNVVFIPETLSTQDAVALSAITWEKMPERTPATLCAIDDVTVVATNAGSAYVAPGEHKFTYHKLISAGDEKFSMTMVGVDHRNYTTKAGQRYSWVEMLKELDPQVLNQKSAPFIIIRTQQPVSPSNR